MPHPAPEPDLLLLPELALGEGAALAPPWASPALLVGLALADAEPFQEAADLDLPLAQGLALARAALLQGFAVPQPAPVVLAPPLASAAAEPFLEARVASGTCELLPELTTADWAALTPAVSEPLRTLAVDLAIAEGRGRTPLLLLQLVELEVGLALGEARGLASATSSTLRVLTPGLADSAGEPLGPAVWNALAPPLALAAGVMLQAHPHPVGDQELRPGLAQGEAQTLSQLTHQPGSGPRVQARSRFAGRVVLAPPIDPPSPSDSAAR